MAIEIGLQQDAIEEAIIDYVKNLGMDLTNKDVQVDLVAGRGANGYRATVIVSQNGEKIVGYAVHNNLKTVEDFEEDEVNIGTLVTPETPVNPASLFDED